MATDPRTYTQPNPKLVELNGQQVSPIETGDDPKRRLDRTWAKIAFMIKDTDIVDPTDVNNRYWSTANAKFTDSRLGGSIGINPRPQWTRYADIRVPGRLPRNKVTIGSTAGNYGLGRAYSESIDDPAQKIFLRFGVPQFNSLTTFLLRAFDREQTVMARTGRPPTIWYTLGKAVGIAIPLVTFPVLTMTIAVGKSIAWLLGRPTSKFFTLKPTMFLYWSMVQSLVNNHLVNSGLYGVTLRDENSQRLGQPYELDTEQLRLLAEMMPDVFGKGYMDVYSIANRAQRIANQVFLREYNALERGTATDFAGYLKRDITGTGNHTTPIVGMDGGLTLDAFLNKLTMFSNWLAKDPETKQESDPRVDPNSPSGAEKRPANHLESVVEHMDAEFRDGSQFACFRVDHTGSMSEAWGNTVGESELAQSLNNMSSNFREARFTFADGNVFGGVAGVAEDMIKGVVGAVTNVTLGALDGVSLGFAGLIPGLGGSGYVDIPKHWQSSSTQLPRGSYKIKLISPYNNPISRLINIFIPFYMLLAAVVPRSTGKQSYTHPFYCQLFDRGRVQSRLAMVESLSITRGTSNLAFDTKGQALAIDVQMNVVDLSSIMHMPMSSGKLTEVDMGYDEDNITADYLAVLAGMDIYSQIYPWPKAQLRLAKTLLNVKQKATSPAYHAAVFRNSLPDIVVNVIEGVARGNAQLEGPFR